MSCKHSEQRILEGSGLLCFMEHVLRCFGFLARKEVVVEVHGTRYGKPCSWKNQSAPQGLRILEYEGLVDLPSDSYRVIME